MTVETLAHGTPVCVSERCRFGQDALLLAHFCGVKKNEDACDLGTGCGIIPLYWHDRGHAGACLAADIAGEPLALLDASLAAGGIGRIRAVRADLRDAAFLRTYGQSFDAVACNPPYFTGGPISPDAVRAAARHELTCTAADVAAAAFALLRDGGRLCVCQRPERLADVVCAFRAARMEPRRLRFVAARPDSPPWLFLLEGRKMRAPGLRVLPTLITRREDGAPTDELLAIYGQPRRD